MFCTECGAKLDNDALFCPECGTRVEVETDIINTNDNSGKPFPDTNILGKGILFTHIQKLSYLLNVSADDILSLLNCFIEAKKQHGIHYSLLDAGSSNFNIGGISVENNYCIKGDAPWSEYAKLLNYYNTQEERCGEQKSTYLFIVGGNEVIPMARVLNPMGKHSSDEDIDTDILYSFQYRENIEQELLSGTILKYELLYMTGRLPLTFDSTFNELKNYLINSLNNPYIKVSRAHAQCDPNWKNVTGVVVSDIRNNGYFPKYKPIPEKYYFNDIFLSPDVVGGNIDNFLSYNAELLFFNLHGHNAPKTPCFLGCYTGTRVSRDAIWPKQMTMLNRPNIIVTEACYGARFIGYDKANSMLISAINNRTLLYLGSSRIAYGAVDGNNPEGTISISCADVITNSYVGALLEGYSAGCALFHARRELLKEEYNSYQATTLIEFNLFGDPTLSIDNENYIANPKNELYLIEKSVSVKPIEVEVKDSDSDNISILDITRKIVNNNILEIHTKISEQLYDYFGIEPRKPSSVAQLTSSKGSKCYSLQYNLNENNNLDKTYNLIDVICDKKGKIFQVYTTR